MALDLYRRLMNLRCPCCDAVQPTFPLLATFKGGLKRFALNDHTLCIDCSARLRLVPRDSVPTAAVQISLALVPILLFFTVAVPLLGGLFIALGLWGLAFIAGLVVACPYLVAGAMGRIGPLYRKVVLL